MKNKELDDLLEDLIATKALKKYLVRCQEFEIAGHVRNEERDICEKIHKYLFNSDINWNQKRKDTDSRHLGLLWKTSMEEVEKYFIENYKINITKEIDLFILNSDADNSVTLKFKCLIADKMTKLLKYSTTESGLQDMIKAFTIELRELKINSILDL